MVKTKQTPRSQRALTALAVAFLATSAAFALGRLFVGRGPTRILVGAAVAAVCLAWIAGRRNVFLSLLLSCVGLAMYAGITLLPETTWHGLPTTTTVRALRSLSGLIGPEARTQIAPTLPLTALMLVAVAGVWAASFAAHALAERAGAPILASLPPVALFAFADVTIGDGVRPIYAALVLAGMLAVIFADGMRRVRAWGPLEPWSGFRRRRHVTASATRGAQGVAAVVLISAVLVPGILPGWGHPSLIQPHRFAGGPGVNPLVSIQAELQRSPAQDLFTVQAAQPAYWRLLALDSFDGVSWSTPDLEASAGRQVDSGGSLTPGVSGTGPLLEQQVQINGLRSPWLPMAYAPVSATLPDGSIRYDDGLTMAVGPMPLPDRYTYTVVSRMVVPTPAELDAAPDVTSPLVQATLPSDFYRHYTELPADTPKIVSNLAHEFATGQPNEYRSLLAIQDALRTHFTYNENIQVPNGVNPLAWFLTTSRSGFCQQFAGAMAAMARALGYPARVAVGFLPGTHSGYDQWRVTTEQAHAWPEVFFPGGLGWVAFEPTPGRENPVAQSYLAAPPFQGGAAAGATGATSSSAIARSARSSVLRKLRRTENGGFTPLPVEHARPALLRIVLLSLAAALVLALLVLPPAKALRRRYLVRRTQDPRRRALAAYRVFEERAWDAGLGREAGATLTQFGASLEARIAFVDGHLQDLLATASRAAYSAHPIDRATADLAVRHSQSVAHDVRRAVGARRVARGWYRIRRSPTYRS